MAVLLAMTVSCAAPEAPQSAAPAVSQSAAPAVSQARETPEILLQTLYSEHKPQHDKQIDFENEAQLARYFSPELTALFMRDVACKKRTEGLCNLDYDPIFAAQDFDDKPLDLVIERQSPTRFKVTYTNMTRRSQIYEVVETSSGWRISDIVYPDWGSLKAQLSRAE